jgi:formylglycine-generating enzyme required for sulfatase activity
VPDHSDVFLSYSRNDGEAAINLRGQLQRCGLNVFKDDERIRAGELWLDRLQEAVGGCGAFIVLVGRDGVRRWIGAETQVALDRYFAPHDDAERLPIFPVLLEGTEAEMLPAFLRLFQMTAWNGADALPERLLDDIRHRTIVTNKAVAFKGCPFVGLAAFRIDQASLFFGRQKETLDALACFDIRRGAATVRWLEINGNSGSGKSSLMQAGLLPLVNDGWLWSRTEIAHWRRIGPIMPGEHPVEMLAEHLARTFGAKMGEVCKDLQDGDDSALRYWLRDKKSEDTAFLLAVDQFEELFTFADPKERRRFDGLLAEALEDADCPLFVISTVRADFLDRFEDLPRLVAARNRLARPWTLAPIGAEGLREVIEGPARLAGLDVSEVKEAMVAEARDEPGALPLVENALHWLWEKRTGNRLRGQLFTDQGGLAGILSGSADGLLTGLDKHQRERALELMFRLVQVDPEARRHTRRRISLAEAIDVAGGGERGRGLVDRLAGQRRPGGGMAEGPLRLITVTEEAGKNKVAKGDGRWVNLIHEMLIRSKGVDATGKAQPYWPTLWDYIEQHKERAMRRERLQLLAREWKDRKGLDRLFGLAGWSSLFEFRGLVAPRSLEHRYLRWSRGRAVVEVIVLIAIFGLVGESVYWAMVRGLPLEVLRERWAYLLGKDLPSLELVQIPAGSFMMGSDSNATEQPVHPVTIAQPFHLSGTEVTFQEWDACVADGDCNGYRPDDHGWGRESRPVINVHWGDAQAYVKWLTLKMDKDCRLPSEAEWEYAARAGTTTEYALPASNGSDDIAGKGLANCKDCGSEWDNKQTAPVRKFPANACGLHDIHGNVFEWVEDCVHTNYGDAPEDGRAWGEENGGDCSRRILRGGSWQNNQDFARSATRLGVAQLDRDLDVGFRVVCSSPSSGSDH